MKMSMEHCWNDNDRGKQNYSEENPVPVTLCLSQISQSGLGSNLGFRSDNLNYSSIFISYRSLNTPSQSQKPIIYFSTHKYSLFILRSNMCGEKVEFLNVNYGFTLSQATKALRESRSIALLYFRPLH